MNSATATLAFAFGGAVLLAACGSKTPDEFAEPEVVGRDTNPDGVPYPQDHIGNTQHAGNRVGDRIANFSFQAYVDGDRAAGLKTVSLADYFDPEQKRYKVLDIQIAAVWCAVCSEVTLSTVKVKDELAKEGVAFLEIVVAGQSASAGPSLAEVDDWVTRHKSNVTTGIDVRARRFGALGTSGSVVPFDILIDTRTMEILDASAGAPQSFNVSRYVQDGLDYVASRPPAY